MAILDVHQPPEIIALLFSDFELRLDSGELLRSGVRIKLQPRPAQVLAVLALHAGTAVSREEIRTAVWGEESHLDFDLSLNYCIRQIRRALDDSAEEPRFVTTLPRVGYRFLAPVEVRRREPEPSPVAVPAPAPPVPPAASRRPWAVWRQIVAAALALLIVGSLVALRSRGGRMQDPEKQAWANLKGHYFETHDDPDKAWKAFEGAERAPRSAAAWAHLAHEVLEDEKLTRKLAPSLEVAEQQALALDPQLALAHLNRAVRLFRFEYDWPGAEREFLRALELDLQNPEMHYKYAELLSARGRHDEALEQIDRAQWLRPKTILLSARQPWHYYLARRYDEAIAQARRQIAHEPPGTTSETNPQHEELFWAFRTILLATLAKGDRAAAFEAARADAHWLGEPRPASLDGYWLTKRDLFAKVGAFRPWSRAVVAIGMGDRERALDLLLQTCQERSDAMIPFLKVDPLYDSLQSHPRFPELLRCANLEKESV